MRFFISLSFILILGVFGDSQKPNILFLFADDLGRYASAYRCEKTPSVNDLLSTPTFDQIAQEGVLAQNAFVSAPSCTPCRASLISGRHFFTNGSCSQLHHRWHGPENNDPWNKIQGYAHLLEKSGYHIGLTHKNHVKGNPFGAQYSKAGRKVNTFSQNVSKADDIEQAKKLIYDECRNNFQSFLKERKPGQPFLYHFHPTNTHRKWVVGSGKKLWNLDPNQLKGKLPPFLPDVPTVREDMADYLGETMAFDECCRILIEELKKIGEYNKTLIIISGDHGAPGFPRGKTNCYDFGSRVLFAARWPGNIKPGQVLEEPISLIDLAPTFLAAAGITKPSSMHGENLLPALKEGKHDNLRSWALIGREVHVETARHLQLPYPMRAIRTKDYLYILNFKPDRQPMGDPLSLSKSNKIPFDELANNTRLSFADVDASPTKAFFIQNRNRPDFKYFWDLGFGPRPSEELYDLKNDPHQLSNVALSPGYSEARNELRKTLMAELQTHQDPRVFGDQFDFPPYSKIGLPQE